MHGNFPSYMNGVPQRTGQLQKAGRLPLLDNGHNAFHYERSRVTRKVGDRGHLLMQGEDSGS